MSPCKGIQSKWKLVGTVCHNKDGESMERDISHVELGDSVCLRGRGAWGTQF